MARTSTFQVLIFGFYTCHSLGLLTLSVPNTVSSVAVKNINNSNHRNNKLAPINVEFVVTNSTSDLPVKNVPTSFPPIFARINSSLSPRSSFDDPFLDYVFSSPVSVTHFLPHPIANTETKSSISSEQDKVGSFDVPESPARRKYKNRNKTRVRRPRPKPSTPSSLQQRFGVGSSTISPHITSVKTTSVFTTSFFLETESSIVTTTLSPSTATSFETTASQLKTDSPKNQSNHSPIEILDDNVVKKDNFNSTVAPAFHDREVTFLGRLSFRLMDALEKVILSNEALLKLSQTALTNFRPVNVSQFACIDPHCSPV